MKKKTILDILNAKGKKKLVCTTAYTFPVAELLSTLDFDVLLIGDSVGMEIQGYKNTVRVTLQDILYHSRAVVRANQNCFVVADMPFLSTDISIAESVRNAGMLVQQSCVDAVKIEGGIEKIQTIQAILNAGIPVMGHIGLNPQKILKMGSYTVQGKDHKSETHLIQDAKALEKAGVFSIVLECVPPALGKKITKVLSIPTIGIGAGPDCDGQILVSNDILGFHEHFKPKFVKEYAHLFEEMKKAFLAYQSEVRSGKFPDSEHSY
jgi:3-methyl-2-oxobutanoate hydroxymethyltransferase